MPRLPIPGQDAGQWGGILNDYLSQSHKSDGSLKDNAVTAATIAPNTIPESALDPTVQSKLNSGGGTSGATGSQGPAGPTGQTGATGTQGPAGTNGLQGATGAQGTPGTNGTNGATGATGPTGPQGTAGTPGSQGATGATGAQGTQGPAGATGPEGPAGTDGQDGTDGATGPQGATGAQGDQGATGPQGIQGAPGATGPIGPSGNDGATGAVGSTGPAGATTIEGISGLQSALDGKIDTTATLTAAGSQPILHRNLNYTLDVNDSNLVEYAVDGSLKSWLNEWGALRGTSPYSWGDALVRAVRDTGDGISGGHAIEVVDRRSGAPASPNNIMFGVRWGDGRLTQGGNIVGTVYTLNADQDESDIPSTLPAGTLIVRRIT